MSQFDHLLEMLDSGCPPHAGMALGFDRLIALLVETDSIRDVIAFPKNQKGVDPVVDSPSKVNAKELKRYGLMEDPQALGLVGVVPEDKILESFVEEGRRQPKEKIITTHEKPKDSENPKPLKISLALSDRPTGVEGASFRRVRVSGLNIASPIGIARELVNQIDTKEAAVPRDLVSKFGDRNFRPKEKEYDELDTLRISKKLKRFLKSDEPEISSETWPNDTDFYTKEDVDQLEEFHGIGNEDEEHVTEYTRDGPNEDKKAQQDEM